jgi:hypothetical protein
MPFLPPIAALDDILRALIPVVVFVIWIVSQIMGGDKKQKVQQARQQGEKQNDEALRREIESFLRENEGEGQPVEVVEVAKPVQVDAEAKAPRRLSDYESTAPGHDAGETVAEHVATHIDDTQFIERASHLGEEVGLADDKLVARLHSTFDHTVGSLSNVQQPDPSPEEGLPADSLAVEVAAMFRNPTEVRKAIIFSEIMKRPTDRLS